MEFGTAVVLITMVPVMLTALGCALFMLWDDYDNARFYRDLYVRQPVSPMPTVNRARRTQPKG